MSLSSSSSSSDSMEGHMVAAPVTTTATKKKNNTAITTTTTKKKPVEAATPVDVKKKKKKTKIIQIEVSDSESDSVSEEKIKLKPRKSIATTTDSNTVKKATKVSHVKEPKKAKKPSSSSSDVSPSARKSKKEVENKKQRIKETSTKKKKQPHAAYSTDDEEEEEEEEDDIDTDESDTPKKKKRVVILKKDQELEIPEMTRLIAAYASGADEKKIQHIYDNWPKLYQRLVTIVTPYRRVWCHSSCPGRLMLRLKGDNFIMVNRMENVVQIAEPYTKKDDFRLESLYKKYVDKNAVVDKKNRDGRLFELLSTEDSLTEPVQLVSKMKQLIIHDPENEKSYWINTPEGREILGPVINTEIKKFDDDTIANEIAKVIAIRKEIIEIFASSKSLSPPPGSKRATSSNHKKRPAVEELVDEEKVTKKTKKPATTTTTTTTPPPKPTSSKKKESSSVKEKTKVTTTTPSPTTANNNNNNNKKKSKTVTEKDDKSKSKKVEPSIATNVVVIPETATTKSPVKIRKSVVKPTVATAISNTTVVVDMDEETKAKIMKMSSTEIYEMLQNEKKRVDNDNKVEFENVEWYERFDMLMGTNSSKSSGSCVVPVVKIHH